MNHRTLIVWMLGIATLAAGSALAEFGENQYRSYPAVVPVNEGISWPEGQALPIFAAPADELDAIAIDRLSADEQLTFSALQGRVNKQQPRIFLASRRSDEGWRTWPQTSTVGLDSIHVYERESRYELFAKYAADFGGVVLYDSTLSPHYRNLAGTVAGISGAIPVTDDVLERMRDQGMDPEIVVDLTKLDLITPIEIYEHLYDEYWDRCTRRLIVSARPADGGDLHHTRDVAAACGAAVVWLDSRIPAERDLMRKFYADMTAGDAIALGWYASERSGITAASEFGIGTLPADHYTNASVLSGGDHRIQIPAVPKKPKLQNKAYIAIFISDGDNIQYTQHAMRLRWDAGTEARSQMPLNWTIAPGLVDIGPGILNYYYSTATSNDCFVTGPSGMGYAMPANTLNEPGAAVGVYLKDPQRMKGYARMTETYLQRSGIRVITIWDNATAMQRAAYERECRNLYGATVQNFRDVPSVRGSVESDRVRFEKLVIPYAGTVEHLESSLQQNLSDWDGKEALFLAYQVDVWNELKPNRIVEIASRLREQYPGAPEFVRADHYFALYNEVHGLAWNLSMSAATTTTSQGNIDVGDAVSDGTPTSLWTARAADSAPSPWLQWDLGSDCRLQRFVIRHAGEHGLNRDKNTRGFTIRTSRDEQSWQTVGAVADNTASVSDLECSPVNARFVRLIIDDAGADNTARIADVEIYGHRTSQD
ncbi:galactose-binding domain-containing protein [Allorhodopirellula solitaria]|uniref:F5/8 type C domain protein n=1 Tax=Allorhodopirellula solitaria TaxID=2527987 RepID=A0A5C5XTR8_9BACT|nr:discoidin domain-containing protein [Allorhodopirellula solitaria]TWT66607.1 F5/8 type C domain protein [Allorhodopirellula solitaria]